MEPQPPNSGQSALRRMQYRYAGLGLELAGGIVGFLLVGLWVDYKFGTAPVGVIVGASIGCVGGFYNFIRQAIRLDRQQKALARRKQETSDRDAQSPD